MGRLGRLPRRPFAHGGPIHVRSAEADQVTFLWSATGSPAQVTLALAPNGDGPKLTATELPFHLAVLAVAGLVRDLRAGRERRWELELAQQWDRRLERLRLLVERE